MHTRVHYINYMYYKYTIKNLNLAIEMMMLHL